MSFRSSLSYLATPATIIACSAIFCLAAVYNGFPFLYYADSVSYLLSAHFLKSLGDRPIFYGLYLALTRLITPSSWVAIIGQGLLTVLLIRWVLSAHNLRRINIYSLVICSALAIFTGICWQVGQLMPDLFTPLLALSFYLLIFRQEELGSVRANISAFIFLFSLLVHYSHWTIMAACISSLFLCYWPARRLMRARPPVAVINLILITVPLTVAVNQLLEFNFFYSRNQYAFLMSRMVEDGSVSDFLEKKCAEKSYIFCDRREQMKRRDGAGFLWGTGGPYTGYGDQAMQYRELILAIIRSDPVGQFSLAMTAFGRQLLKFESGEGSANFPEDSEVMDNFREASSKEVGSFLQSRQKAGVLVPLFSWLNSLYVFVFSVSVLFLVGFLLRAGSNWHKEKELVASLLIFCLSNAFVCGVFSSVYDRYQARVSWLPVFALLLILAKKRSSKLLS